MKNYVKEYKGYKVPEGAEEYQERKGDWFRGFYKESDDALFFYNCEDDNPKWRLIGCVSSDEKPSHVIQLPEAPQEWIPEIGEECEVMTGPFEWSKCIADYIGSEFIVYTANSGEGSSIKKFFRPLKTQQEKEREAFELKAFEISEVGMSFHDLIGELFDNGARFTAPKAADNDQK
tara:strand:- start:877 stop:1404 length:528 start_codon:yes stop_codon:yes gene_type:complete